MNNNRTYAVFGLGRYGRAVAKELVDNGMEVLAVDMDEDRVNLAADEVPFCKCANVTDPDVIRQLGISNVDVVVVAMASHLEASVMAVMLCKEAGVKTVIAKCASEMNCRILERVGADRVVFPEMESGIHLAKNLIGGGFIDLAELSDDISVLELPVRPEWAGKTLRELNLRNKYSVNVIAIRRGGKYDLYFSPEEPLLEEMRLIVIANTEKLKKIR